MKEIPDINILTSDHEAFNNFVYTPVTEAVIELKRRWNDSSIKIDVPIPEILKDGFGAILYVSLITPNYQIRRYVTIADAIDFKPVIFEQLKDKFTSNNDWKHSLGQLNFFTKVDINGDNIIDHINVIDFPMFDGKPLHEVRTYWGQPLIDFQHEMFLKTFPKLESNIVDVSDWVHSFGENPKDYYPAFLSLLIKHGIQFENFMLDRKELWFTKEIFLPAFIEVYKKTGLKPLIVALEPTEIEGSKFWISHPLEEKEWVKGKMI